MPNFWRKNSFGKHAKTSTVSIISEDIPHLEDMTKEEISIAFDRILDDMNLTDEKKEVLRKHSEFQKKQMLDMNYRRTLNIKPSNATNYVQMLTNKDLKPFRRANLLRIVRVHIRSETLPWIKSFGRNGLLAIVENIKIILKLPNITPSSDHIDPLHEAVLCISCFINSTYGMEEALKIGDLMLTLTECLSVGSPHMLPDLLKIIAAVCIYPQGHEKVLEGFTKLRKVKKYEHRFVDVVEGMRESSPVHVQSMCLQLMNAIVSTPDEFELRQHLRCEFMRAGLAGIYHTLGEYDSPDVKTHVDIFKNQLNEDVEELNLRFKNFSHEFYTLDECWGFLRGMLRNGQGESYLISILQHLLFIRDDSYTQLAYLGLVDSLVGQVVLQKGGVDPDPEYRLLSFDFEQITSNFVNQMSKKEEAMETVKEEYETKLTAALSAKMEAESKNSLLEARLSEVTNGNTKLNLSFKSTSAMKICKYEPPNGSPYKYPVESPSAMDEAGPIPMLEIGVPLPPLPLKYGKVPIPPPPLKDGKVPVPPPPLGGKVPIPPPLLGGKVPPPPPGLGAGVRKVQPQQLPFGMEKKQKIESGGVTKRINWTKIKPEIFDKQCFWVKAKEERFYDPSLLKSVETFFASQQRGQEKISLGGAGDTLKRKLRELKVIDNNTSQAISILIANLRLTPDELKREFLAVNCAKIQSATLEQLLKALPEDSMLGRLLEFASEYDDLADSEKYLFKLSEINGLRTRAQLMLFMQQYDESLSENKSSIASVTEACSQITESTKLSDVLEIVLLIGNILNINTRNSETYGFDIMILPKLNDTKSFDGSLSFMHFLVETIENKCPQSLTFYRDLTSLKKASIVFPDMVKQSLAHYERNILLLERLIPEYVQQCDGDNFASVFQDFFDRISPQQTLLVDMKARMDESYEAVTQFFALSARSVMPNDFFEAISKFCQQFKDTHEEIQTRREMEARKKAITKIKTKPKTDKFKGDQGIMDNLVEALKSGSAFKHENRRRRVDAQAAKNDFAKLLAMNDKK